MKAARIHQYGDIDVLKLEETTIPQPQADEVQIRVVAAGVNPVDWKTRQGGGIAGMWDDPFPATLGYDVAGVVTKMGGGVTRFAVGDEVYGMVNFPIAAGTYAEYVVTSADQIAAKPQKRSFIEAAALPLVALTAWQALFDAANLQAGQRVLIHAAAGGVGHVAVQLAKWKGAHVIGTASAHNESFLRELGVNSFINYRTQSFVEILRENPVDVVLATIGGATHDQSFEVLTADGVVASIVGPPSNDHGAASKRVMVHADASQLQTIAELADAGQIRPIIDTVYPLADIAQAHAKGEEGHVRGKLVLEVAG